MRWLLAVVSFCAALPLAALAEMPADEAVSLPVAGGHLDGTLTIPGGAGPFSVALIVAGSGPVDRNGNSGELRGDTYAKLARALAAGGIASLRYDKRSIGTSFVMKTESEVRFGDMVDDAERFAAKLESDPRFRNVVVVGHSEGSLVGIRAAELDPKLSGVVSLEGAGRDAATVLDEQLGADPAVPPAVLAHVREIDASLRAGKTVPNVDPALAGLFRPSVQPYLVSWFALDPAKEIARLHVPVLIVQGTTDLQVSLRDERLLAAADPKAATAVIEGMNHALVDAPADRAGNFATYGNAALPLDPVLVPALVTFIDGVPASQATSAPMASPSPEPLASTGATATPSAPVASASPSLPDAATVARAKTWVRMLQTGKVDRAQLSSQANTALTDALVTQSAAQFGPLGDPVKFEYFTTKIVPGTTAYIFKVTFSGGQLYYLFGVDSAGKITSLRFAPVSQ